jgi:phosphate transport system permease protein
MTAPTASKLRPQAPTLGTVFARGEHWVWFSGAALAAAMLLIAGLLLIIVLNGGGTFWPRPLTQAVRADGVSVLGVVSERGVLREQLPEGGVREVPQTQLKVANRDLFGADFVWYRDEALSQQRLPEDAVAVERVENGDFFGFLKALKRGEVEVATGAAAWAELEAQRPGVVAQRARLQALQRDEVGRLNDELRRAELALKRARLKVGPAAAEDVRRLEASIATAKARYAVLGEQVRALDAELQTWVAVLETADGRPKELPLAAIVDLWRPNQMGLGAKLAHAARHAWWFVSEEPRESNQEGGVFPALFGTVMMTLLMTLACTPLGVVTALYLREYARQGVVVRIVRIAVNNLAGVPSIVFGVFGLGFFVYFIGGNIDRLFYAEALPNPTFGTGGILWASLTLALLTVPVVIVSAEEAIAAVPRGMREGSLALGASKFQTITRIVLPAALPGILTGVILAMARGAGEVAPLMITGVVKLAPELPFDGLFPFFHLDRKFMHLGFHIYDVGFQSPNVEASKPMVFTTTLLLIGIVVALNLAAIHLRNRIRRKYQTGAFN